LCFCHRGGNKPLDVEVISSADLAFGEDGLIPTFPAVETDNKIRIVNDEIKRIMSFDLLINFNNLI